MKKNIPVPSADTQSERDEALFSAIQKKKKRKKRRIIITVVVILLIVAFVLVIGTIILRRKVTQSFASTQNSVTSAEATVGSISTTVSGSGRLVNVDEESVTVPSGVTVEEILVSRNDTVSEGDAIATVNLSSVMDAMSSLQDEIDDLDDEIADAADDTVSSKIAAGVAGRIKAVYAEAGDNVSTCMYRSGALAVLSLDGYMAVDIETDSLTAGDTVNVVRPDGSTLTGSVDSISRGIATILVSDAKALPEEAVTVTSEDGILIGNGMLYIHNALRVTGITGTVSKVSAELNKKVTAGTLLFTLTDTSYSADYEALIAERADLEDELLDLMQLYRDGAVLAPFNGSVSSVDISEDTTTTEETSVATLNPAKSMSVSISVDESDILSLEVGQTASVTISSIGDDAFTGTVTEINKTATSSSGVTYYTAVVTLDRDEQMLSGMSASVSIRINGVDNAILIPVEALHQTSSTAYVYTTYDEDTMTYGGEVEVTTGLSNSTYVEITSGLSEGDTVWYEPESESFDFSGFGDMGGDFSGGNFGGGDTSGFGGDTSDFNGGGDMPTMPGGDSSHSHGNFGGNS